MNYFIVLFKDKQKKNYQEIHHKEKCFVGI
jgi:hypothetical protein